MCPPPPSCQAYLLKSLLRLVTPGCEKDVPAALDCVDALLLKKRELATERVGTFIKHLASIAPHVDPQNADQARFSLHYMVASALVHGSVRLSAFDPERLNDPATRSLMQRIAANPAQAAIRRSPT